MRTGRFGLSKGAGMAVPVDPWADAIPAKASMTTAATSQRTLRPTRDNRPVDTGIGHPPRSENERLPTTDGSTPPVNIGSSWGQWFMLPYYHPSDQAARRELALSTSSAPIHATEEIIWSVSIGTSVGCHCPATATAGRARSCNLPADAAAVASNLYVTPTR